MTWEEVKQVYPVGSIQQWTVRSVHPFGVFMETSGPEVSVLLSVLELRDNPVYPAVYPAVGETVRCVVLDHSPLDQRVCLSARASQLRCGEYGPSEPGTGTAPTFGQ